MLNKLLDFLFIDIPVKLRKRIVMDYFNRGESINGRILLYYKTDSLYSKRLVRKSIHTNDAEITYMVSLFDRMGFIVDVIDRSAKLSQLDQLRGKEYSLFVSNIGGNSAPYHQEIMAMINPKKVIAYVMGPEPVLSCKLVAERHDYFKKRTGVTPVVRRLVKGGDQELSGRFEGVDAFISNGKNFSIDSYKKFDLPIYRVPSTISTEIKVKKEYLESKRKNSFLYFGGNGLICKGLDLVLEAFDGMEGVELHVCGPDYERDFWDHYGPLVERNPHIHFHGFIRVGSRKFYNLLSQTSFNLFPSSSEGCATSVITAMRMGVIPVVSYESDVDVKDFGVELSKSTPENVKQVVEELMLWGPEKLKENTYKTYFDSLEYCEDNFKFSLLQAISKTLFLR